MMSPSKDGMVIAVRVLATIVLPLGAAIALWNAWTVLRSKRSLVGEAVGHRARRRLPRAAVHRHRLPRGRLLRQLLTATIPRGGRNGRRAHLRELHRDPDRPRRARAAQRTAAPVRSRSASPATSSRASPVTVVTLRQGHCIGRGEAAGVYYMHDEPADMLRTLGIAARPHRGRRDARRTARHCCRPAARATRSTARCGNSKRAWPACRRGNSPGMEKPQAAADDLHRRRRRSGRDGRAARWPTRTPARSSSSSPARSTSTSRECAPCAPRVRTRGSASTRTRATCPTRCRACCPRWSTKASSLLEQPCRRGHEARTRWRRPHRADRRRRKHPVAGRTRRTRALVRRRQHQARQVRRPHRRPADGRSARASWACR